jgi:predicted alpha/beta-hydrolase family hydrolase
MPDHTAWVALGVVVARYTYHYLLARPQLQRERILNRALKQRLGLGK